MRDLEQKYYEKKNETSPNVIICLKTTQEKELIGQVN